MDAEKTTPSLPTTRQDAPLTCPSCASVRLTTASKTINASTYWRCTACGEVWNVARRQETLPYSRRQRRW